MKTLFWLALLPFSVHLLAQDSIPKNKLPIGVYVKEKEFLERKPSIMKAFKIVPNVEISFNEQTNKNDTVETGITYQFIDSTQKHKNAFGFCNGTDIYLGNNWYGYTKMDYIGRFSFISTNYDFTGGKGIFIPNPFTPFALNIVNGVVFASKNNPSQAKRNLFFINKSGNLHEATGQAIGWLLKDDKDFLQEFNAEKKYSNEVFKKYLVKMNERYPE